MSDFDDFDHYFRLFDAIDDAEIALADPITLLGGEFFRTGWPRVVAQGLHAVGDAQHIILGDAAKILGDRGAQPQPA